MLDGVLVELALFIGVALARAGVGRLRVPTFTLRALLLPLVDAFLCRGAAVRRRLDEGELFTVGEGPVVFDAVVHAVVVLEGDVVEFRWLRAFFVDCYVQLVWDCVKRSVYGATSVGNLDELHGQDVVGEWAPDAEDVIDAGDGEGVAADGGDELTRPDGEGLGTVLAGASSEGTAMRSGI